MRCKSTSPITTDGYRAGSEIEPFRDRAGVDTPTFFHNVTFVVCRFGT